MRLIIIPADGKVFINDNGHDDLTLSGIPSNVHALQWFDGDAGEIEYNDGTPNQAITSLPSWASTIATERQAVIDQEIADMEAAQAEYDAWAASDAGKAELNRTERDRLLRISDWTQGEDVPTAIKSAYTSYRQSLRDLPSHANWPNLNDSDWPTKPE